MLSPGGNKEKKVLGSCDESGFLKVLYTIVIFLERGKRGSSVLAKLYPITNETFIS